MKPTRRLPPLNALRSFEVAARHLSFTKAADELGVTPAAVSLQIKLLEDHLGVSLFSRVNKYLMLTEAAQLCLPGIRAAFDGLAAAVDRIGSTDRSGILTVSVAPSFAAKWLVPRLERFQTANPEMDVHVSASMQLVDFGSGEVDLAVRYGAGKYPGLVSERLLSEIVVPVCGPALLKGPNGLRKPSDIRFHTLLHDDSPDEDETCPNWAMWLKAAGVEGVDVVRGPRFNQSSLVLEAAVLGRGIALAKSTIAAADLAAGRVVRPFELSFPVDFAYYLVYPETKQALPKVETFRRWLQREAKASTEAVTSGSGRKSAGGRKKKVG